MKVELQDFRAGFWVYNDVYDGFYASHVYFDHQIARKKKTLRLFSLVKVTRPAVSSFAGRRDSKHGICGLSDHYALCYQRQLIF